MPKLNHITAFKAVSNTVIGILDTDAEEQVVICQCCSVPGYIAEEVARQIARLLNTPELQTIRGIGFSISQIEDDKIA